MRQEFLVAAKWWADVLRAKAKQDNGDPSLTGMYTRGLMDMLAEKVQPTAEQCDMFELLLAGKLAEKIGNSDGWHEAIAKGTPDWGSCSRCVSCDYHPHPILAEVAAAAGIMDDCPPLPVKTVMWINPGRVTVRYGYGAEREEIYSGPENDEELAAWMVAGE